MQQEQDLFNFTDLAALTAPKGEFFRNIVDNLPISVFVKDEKLRLIYANAACAHRIGIPREDVIGRTDAEFFAPDVAEVFLRRDQEVLDSGVINHTEEETEDRDGVLRIWATTKARFLGAAGKHYMV